MHVLGWDKLGLAGVLLISAAAACAGSSTDAQLGAPQPQLGEEPPPPPRDAGSDADGGDGDADTEDPEPLPDLSAAHPSTRKEPVPLGLELSVSEKGPHLPWAVSIVNRGTQPVDFVADARLLWFEVKVPGKKAKAVTCRLPEDLFPDGAEDRLIVTLEPGEGVVEAFDPRLYCFTLGGQRALVPGAVVTPYFGWPDVKPKAEKPKPQRRRGARKSRVKAAAKESAPLVASLALDETDDAAPPAGGASDAGAPAAPSDVLSIIEGQPFGLRSEYKEWTSTRIAEDDKVREQGGPLVLRLLQGSDARAEQDARITLTLRNVSDESQRIYFRRELVTFEVVGAEGIVTCDPQPDERAPDRSAFTTLRAGGSMSVTSRLIELCPQRTFARPGLYLVHARYDAVEDGSKFGLRAFVGPVVSSAPAGVRIRTGEFPLLQKQPMRTVRWTDAGVSEE